MMIGSAASLHRDERAMSPSHFRSTRVGLAGPMAEGAPPRWPAQALAASDPPRGRILLVENQAVVALDLQRVLRAAGFRVVGPATSIADIGALKARGRIDCAVLDLDGAEESVPAIADLLTMSGMPFVFLTSCRDAVPARHANRLVVDKPYSTEALLAALDRAMSGDDSGILYPVAPPTVSWPRVMPQL